MESLKGYPDEECMVEMLDYWLRHHPDHDQPTWKEIADAIEDIQDYNLARSIKEVYELASKLTAMIVHCQIHSNGMYIMSLNPAPLMGSTW